MADVNRGNRPLSPHLSVYRWQITMMMSIAHRITGVGLAVGALMMVWWFSAAAAGPEAFAAADGVLTHWFVVVFLWFPLLLAFWYHFANGIRHLMWDTGYGMSIPEVYSTGYAALALAAVLALVTIFAA